MSQATWLPRSRPRNRSANPGATASTMQAAQTIIAGLLRSTALMLVTTAVTVSTLRSTIIGNEKAAAENTIAAKIEPIALPMPKNVR